MRDRTCVQCCGPLKSSPSDDFCSDSCQTAWHSKGADHAIVRPRTERPAPVVPPASWPTIAIPHPAGGVTYARTREEYQRHLGDTAPVEEPPHPSDAAWTHEQERTVTGNITGRGVEFTVISTPSHSGDFLRRLIARRKRP